MMFQRSLRDSQMQVCSILRCCMIVVIHDHCTASLDHLLLIGQGRSDTLQSDVIVNSITIGTYIMYSDVPLVSVVPVYTPSSLLGSIHYQGMDYHSKSHWHNRHIVQ